MAWSDRPTIGYRAIRLLLGAVIRVLFDVRVEGREHVPRPGSIVVAVPHRNWVEPVLVATALPARPRLVGVADHPTIAGSLARRLLISAIGGAIATPHVARVENARAFADATAAATSAGAIVAVFPEVGAPSRPPTLRTLSPGIAHLAARAGARVTPIVLGGSHDLYLRRRVVVRLLPAVDPPASTTRADLVAWMGSVTAIVATAAIEAHHAAESSPLPRKRWRWLNGKYPRAD